MQNMLLELYVWGPAFSLPSIDAQCLASIAYVSQAVPPDEWILVASNNPAASPIRELPVLHDDTQWIGGFQNIVDHLRTRSIHLEEGDYGVRGNADITAFSSFVECQGQPLLDLILYVSNENYHSSTRPAYAKILQWPQQWFLPSHRRTAAKGRTKHLDIFSLDLDSNGREPRTRTLGSDPIPESLRGPRQTLSSLIQQTQHASRFRLEALADSFLEPLEQLLDDKRYLITDAGPSSLDCLAFAYLALASVPDVPQPWFAETMKDRHSTLCTYVQNLNQDFFGGPVHVGDAFPDLRLEADFGPDHAPRSEEVKNILSLPWAAPQLSGWKPATSALLGFTFDSMLLDDRRIVKQEGSVSGTYEIAAAITTALLALGSYLVIFGFPGSNESKPRTLSDMGEAGAMLSFIDSGRPEPRNNDSAPVAEVAVAVNEGRKL